MAKKKQNKGFVIFLAVVTTVSLAGLGGSLFGGVSPNNAPAQNSNLNNSAELSGVPCLTIEEFHLHPHLTITFDGEEVPIPANIGVEPNCFRELHTHDSDGVIHVESDVDKGYAFSDFLNVWGFPIEQAGLITRLTVNGEFNDNDTNFVLEDGQEIVLEFINLPDFAAPEGDQSQGAAPEVE